MDLEDKVSIITRGARGIGRSISLCLAAQGANIVIADVNEYDSEKVIEEAARFGTKGLALKVDITKKSDLENMVKSVISSFGKIDIL